MKINKAIAEKIGAALLVLGVIAGSGALLVPSTSVTSRSEKLTRDLTAFSVFFLTSSGVLIGLASVPDRKESSDTSTSRNREVEIKISRQTPLGHEVSISFAAEECTDSAMEKLLANTYAVEQAQSNIELEGVDSSREKVTKDSELSTQETLESGPVPKAIAPGTPPIQMSQEKLESVEQEVQNK
ncbi:MAG: hypothetical protein AAGN15_04465 [Cyanobacteria bacterium J06581_3]